MLKCLDNYIGIKYCGNDNPASDLFVNDLPGMSLKAIDASASDEQSTFVGVWNVVQKRALTKFTSLVTNNLKKKYQINTLLESFDGGQYIETDVIPQNAEYRGVMVAINTGDRPISHQSIRIDTIRLYKTVNTAVAVRIYDAETGQFFHQINVGGNVGWVEFNINKTYFTRSILIVYNSSGIGSQSMPYNRQVANQYSIGCGCEPRWFSWGCSSLYASYSGVIADLSNPANYTRTDNTYGLSVVASIGCSYESFICSNKDLFKVALQYWLGWELLQERIYSDRINRYTTIDLNRAKELAEHYKQTIDDEFAAIFDGLNLSKDCCIECNDIVNSQHYLP